MRKAFGGVAALLTGLIGLTGCSGADLLNLTVPRSGYDVTRDIAYGTDDRQKLDIYVPEGAQNAPVILFFYGGSWQWGSKEDYRFVGQAFAAQGFVTVIADYRLYPQVFYPDFVADGAQALAWTHHRIAEYGGDPQKLFVAGHSAGGFNAAMLVLNEPILHGAGAARGWVSGVIGISGPYDFLPFTDPKVKATFSKVPDAQTQPINFVHGKLPPFFLATGVNDNTVRPKNSEHLAARLKANGTPVELHEYDGVEHIGIVLSLANGFRGRAPLLADITDFVNRTAAR